MTTRRRFCASVAALGLVAGLSPVAAEQPVSITDMAGRRVDLPKRPRRIVLLEAHDLLTMSLVHPDPASLVVGWAATERIDSELLETRLLNNHEISRVGRLSPDTLSLESLIALEPDLVVTTAFMTPELENHPMLLQLAKMGIPFVVSDASSNASNSIAPTDPAVALKTSLRALMTMWGRLLGNVAKAEAFTGFVEGRLADIAGRLAAATPVVTYLEVQSTADDCCWAAGRRVWGELLSLAGGAVLPGVTAPWFQKLSLEYVLSTPQEVYIASGGGYATGIRPAIGPSMDPQLGREGLQRLVDGRAGFENLASVQNHRVYGIWTGLITNLPLNILFLAQAAIWLHPDRCADLDPSAILAAINRDFAAFPIDGPLWASI